RPPWVPLPFRHPIHASAGGSPGTPAALDNLRRGHTLPRPAMDGTQLNRGGRTLPRALALVAAALLAAAALPAGASGKTDLSYRNFKQTKGLKLNGSAKKRLHPAVLRLTPNEPDQAGSVFTR